MDNVSLSTIPPHLLTHKYVFVCTITIAIWDTLVLTPRSLKLWRTDGWSPLKILFLFLRLLMPIEFITVVFAFYDPLFTQEMCRRFFLFEPICTAILLAGNSAVHVLRMCTRHDNSRCVLIAMGTLFALQIVVTFICCAYYYPVPLDVFQGCISGPRHTWVGIYWVIPTLLYTVSFVLAIRLSIRSRVAKPIGLFQLFYRQGLNLHFSVWVVNLANVIFWFAITPTGPEDSIRTAATSIAAVLATNATLRIAFSGAVPAQAAVQRNTNTTRVMSTVVMRTTVQSRRVTLETELAEDAGSSMSGSESERKVPPSE